VISSGGICHVIISSGGMSTCGDIIWWDLSCNNTPWGDVNMW
jgi:hypothetical protein